jgi:GcrA cell cycle regulator
LSAGDIAAQMGTTRNAILGKINRLGISRPERQPSKPKLRPAPRQASLAILADDLKLMDEAERFLPAPPKVKHAPGNKTIFELEPRDCRFPLGGPMEPAVLFCGQQALTGRPYCEEHYRLCGGAYRRG